MYGFVANKTVRLNASPKKVSKCLPDKMLMNLGAKIGLD